MKRVGHTLKGHWVVLDLSNTFLTPDGAPATWALLDADTDELIRGFKTHDELSTFVEENNL